ncbi:type II toxin-antitoxin system HicA family toxin [Dactylococcopsis salina]|uniref:Periplasmic or secreted lipoprotein n=1 Tax=Dactylococcopsis salina (strain PCC 8305) TaxID=13035 RepID=K9YPW4_DACS8|nr:type II toxin-antitoxin system HicA family toxin [Dactylococcopsis salina]AFZ48919.1 putative periplasmic or secreted lipoprotein [Dactylococcopsis salina PCC 8305]
MKSISGKKFAKILEQNGWQLLRIQGSHHIYCKPGQTTRISVPIHGNKDLKVGLLRYLMKQASLSEDDLK